MKYQLLRHNKTGSRLLAMLDSMDEVKQKIAGMGLRFEGLSYIGGFPTFSDGKRKTYSVQGAVMFDTGSHVVCSLPQKEAESFGGSNG